MSTPIVGKSCKIKISGKEMDFTWSYSFGDNLSITNFEDFREQPIDDLKGLIKECENEARLEKEAKQIARDISYGEYIVPH